MGDTDLSRWSGQRFGDTLRQLRRASGFTQAELAERANLSTRGLSDLERGINRSPHRETLLALADAFGLDGEERHRFFSAARRRPLLASTTAEALLSSRSAEPDAASEVEPEPALPTADHQPAGSEKQTDDIQIFLIADVRGYSTYTDAHYDHDAAQLALRFAALAGAAVQTHGGQVLEVRGDEVLAVFPSARAALRAAILLQEQVGQASGTTPNQPIRCGIGVEAGEAVAVPGGYRGQAINLAARLCARAGPGEVLAGEVVIGLARKVEGLLFVDRGLASLKGVAVPVRITQVVPAATEALHEPLGGRASAPAPAEPAERPRQVAAVGNFLSAVPRHRLVAREAEMTLLLAALETVQAGTGQLVLLVGEPGVGKTRLAQEVLQVARGQGFGGIIGRCYAPQASVPYYPFLEALARAAAAAPQSLRSGLPLEWPEVARLIPAQRLGLPRASSTSPLEGGGSVGDQQQRLFWQITGFLQALAAEQPLALLVDDLHWADGASLELLLHLARQTRDCPLLLLGTYRESEVPADHPLSVGVRDLIRAQLVERLELSQLTREGTAALLAATLEAGEVSEEMTDLIYGPTEGNAFFVQELLQTLLERGEILETSAGRWEPREGAVAAVPATVQAAVLERVSRLSPSAQETLGLASVLGQRFRFDELLATSHQTHETAEPLSTALSGPEAETRLEAVLEEAVRVRVLREVGGSGYAFSHALAQRALYEQLSIRRRRRIHRAVAQSLEHLGEAERVRRVADIAYHFLQADELAQALPYVLQAGERALEVYAYAEAEQRFRTALELARQFADREAEAVAQEKLLLSLAYISRYNESYAELEHAAIAAEQRGDLKRLARLAQLFSVSMNVDRETQDTWIARLLRLIETIKASEASPELAQFYLSLTNVYAWNDQYVEELSAVEQALQVALLVGDARLVREARLWHGAALLGFGRLDEALSEMEAVVLLIQENVEDLLTLDLKRVALTALGTVLSHLGRLVEAHTHFGGALRVAEQLRVPGSVALACTYCGQTAFVLGDWPAAHSYLRRALALRPHFDANDWVNMFLRELEGRVQLAQGQLDAATQSLEAGPVMAEQLQGVEGRRHAQQMLAELDLHRSDPGSAQTRLLPLLDREGMVELDVNPLLPLLIWAHLDLGEIETAEALATHTVARLRAQHDSLNLVDALRMEAVVHIRQERWDEAETALEEALALAREMPHPYAEAKALSTYGDLLMASGQPEQACEQYEAALAILRPLGEVPYTERIERALAERARHSRGT